jgi:site-specific recombinase XerD
MFSILFWFRKDVRLKNNQGYIMVRITLNGKRAEIATGHKIDLEKWNSSSGCVKGNKEEARTINTSLINIRDTLNSLFTQLCSNKDLHLTVDLIKNTYLGKSAKQYTLLEVFKFHNEQMKAHLGKEFAAGTYERYQTTLKLLQAFIKYQYGKEDISLSELKYAFITDLEFWFKTVRKCNHNTTIKYITNLRKIINLAISNEWIQHDPFAKFKVSLKEVKRECLSAEELQAIERKTFKIGRLDQVKDIFVFSCYTGLAYADVEKLSPQHISKGVDGKYWVFIDRTKTGTSSAVPLLSAAQSIIDKYKDHPEAMNKDRVFPVISNQKMNAYLKEIADVCGIDKKLTFHIARHTFATTVTLTNGVPIETVSNMLGHKNIKTTQVYAKVVQRKVSSDMEALENKINPKREEPQFNLNI